MRPVVSGKVVQHAAKCLLMALWTLPSICAATNDPNRAGTLSLLIYNTHGLPTLFAKDDPGPRFAIIANLTHQYDLALLQEDFAHHRALLRGLKDSALVTRGSDPASKPCLLCSSSGLTFISHLQTADWSSQTRFFEFDTCSGWLNQANDCLAQKGFQIASLESRTGRRLAIINTHLDAGDTDSDRFARQFQLRQIASIIEQLPNETAIIIGGDFNLNWESSKDRELLISFRDRLKLTRAVGGIQAESGWQILDYVFYRSSDRTRLLVIESGEDTSFRYRKRPLSDHPALYVNFQVE